MAAVGFAGVDQVLRIEPTVFCVLWIAPAHRFGNLSHQLVFA